MEKTDIVPRFAYTLDEAAAMSGLAKNVIWERIRAGELVTFVVAGQQLPADDGLGQKVTEQSNQWHSKIAGRRLKTGERRIQVRPATISRGTGEGFGLYHLGDEPRSILTSIWQWSSAGPMRPPMRPPCVPNASDPTTMRTTVHPAKSTRPKSAHTPRCQTFRP